MRNREFPVSTIARALGVSRSNLYAREKSTARASNYSKTEDVELLSFIRKIVSERQTYGYRRTTVMLNKHLAALGKPKVNHKRVYRIMRQNGMLLVRYTGKRPGKVHDGKVCTETSNRRWCSDGFEIPCENGERVRVIFGLDTCDREIMAYEASCTGYTADMAQNVMLGCVEARFGKPVTPHKIEWLTDNGSCYSAKETIQFGIMLGMECRFTPVRSPQSNGMAESFVKTFKRDYIFSHARPDATSVMDHLKEWFEDYNENAPHKALRMLSPREFIRSRESELSPREMGATLKAMAYM